MIHLVLQFYSHLTLWKMYHYVTNLAMNLNTDAFELTPRDYRWSTRLLYESRHP